MIDEKIEEIAKNNKTFSDKDEKAEKGDLIIFDYTASVNGEKFEGSEGKNTRLEIGKDLFIKGFDAKLIGVKKEENKIIEVNLPENYPNKELANKKAKFDCKIVNVQKASVTKIDDSFAKNMGAKDLTDLRSLIEKQISAQYKQALDSITKKEILDQVEKFHKIELPKNLIKQEIHSITHQLKKEDIEKNKTQNLKIAESRIKLGLILNEYGEKNNLKVLDEEVQGEIQKQIKGMPGQEKMVLDYYQKNPSAAQSLKGSLYEEKILNLFKSRINIKKENISINDAEKIISDFNKQSKDLPANHEREKEIQDNRKSKDIKSTTIIKKKTKKVSKK